MWHREFSILIPATPATVWSLFSDVNGWRRWNAGIEQIELHGPFASGTSFTMKPPGQEAFTSTLLSVVEDAGFIDETVIGDIRVLVDHRIESVDDGTVRVTYAARVEGPGAADVGEAVTEDFPQVLEALARLARQHAPAAWA